MKLPPSDKPTLPSREVGVGQLRGGVAAPPQQRNTMEAALAEHERLIQNLNTVSQELHASMEREAILRGQITALESELRESTRLRDHYLRWNVEITRQLHNIGMFVEEAMRMARQEVEKGNSGRAGEEAMGAVEKAITQTKESL
jgi:VIT1/CCC1 family predicted Fe2+/Mn2+ transporter